MYGRGYIKVNWHFRSVSVVDEWVARQSHYTPFWPKMVAPDEIAGDLFSFVVEL
jgi:hypothetical protein